MRLISLFIALALTMHISHAQQYAWQVIARPTQTLAAVDFVDSLHGWTAWGSTQIFRTTDGGFTWAQFSGSPFVVSSISMADSLVGWCAGGDGLFGRITRTTTGGTAWQLQLETQQQTYNGASARSSLRNTTSGEKISGPDTGLVVQSTDAGATWQGQRLTPNTRLGKVVFVDSLHGWINANLNQGAAGAVFRTSDGGVSWQQLATPVLFSAIEFLDTVHGWAASGGTFYRTINGGISWDSLFAVPFPGDDFHTYDLSFTDSLYGWAFGGAVYQGNITEAIYHTTNGGITWYRESIGLTDDLGDLSDGIMLDRTHGWTVAADGRVLAYRLVTSVPERLPEVPTSFSLRQNYPNPFNPTTTIEYELTERAHVQLRVFDNLGREVSVLVNAPQEAGVYRVRLDGNHLASGVYTVVLETKREKHARQIVLVK